MDPSALDLSQWRQLTSSIYFLWLWVPFMVTFALCMLTALALIPSMVGSRHLSQRTIAMRPPLFIVGFLSLVGGIGSLYMALSKLGVIDQIYTHWLI